MKNVIVFLVMLGSSVAYAGHEMQHGFILDDSDHFASHLVANGHHSRQVEIAGELVLGSTEDRELYRRLRAEYAQKPFYFLFQAQGLDLAALRGPQLLKGHIVLSPEGQYQPKNVIIQSATFRIDRVILNVENPFFKED